MNKADKNSAVGILSLAVYTVCGTLLIDGLVPKLIYFFLFSLSSGFVYSVYSFLIPRENKKCKPNWFTLLPFSVLLIFSSLVFNGVFLPFWLAGSGAMAYDAMSHIRNDEETDIKTYLTVAGTCAATALIPTIITAVGGITV